MISSVPVRMTSGSMWSAGHASTAARGTPPATPPGVPPRWSTPVRACRLAREDGRMFCCCHIDVGPHAVDDNPVARSEAMPRRSLRQFTNISNMVFNEALRGVASSGEEVGTPGRTISLLRPKLASCPRNFALGLIKRLGRSPSREHCPTPTSFLYCSVRTLRSNGEPTEPTANALTI